MVDIWNKTKRSEVMAAVHSSGNRSTELRMVSLFKEHKIKGWRRHQSITGHPDFIFGKERLVVFVDGCFWHGCPRCYTPPATNKEFWKAKVENNRKRDRRVTRILRAENWIVVRVWECSLKKHPKATAARIKRMLKQCSIKN